MAYTSCFNTASIELGCAASVGGIKKLYVLAGEITGTTYNPTGQLSGATGTGDVYTFELQKQTSNVIETFQVSLENGTTYFEQVTTAIMNKMDQDKRNQLKLLSRNRQIVLFLEDNNDTLWYLGGDFNGGWTSAGTGDSGTAFGDRNGYSISVTTYSKEPMTTLDGTLASVLSGITINP
tara:strand:+ start:2409 stop:2945 length:537 start_codon:yes stop_codon:yes gene_type:complete